MSERKFIKSGEYIVATNAAFHYGSGWANHTIAAVICDTNNQLRVEYIQPDELTAEISDKFTFYSNADKDLMRELNRAYRSYE